MKKQSLAFCVLTVFMALLVTVPSEATTTHKFTLLPPAFTSSQYTDFWYSEGFELAGLGRFYAPLNLPLDAQVTSITFYVYDNDPNGDICMRAYLFAPATQAPQLLGNGNCSSGTSQTNPQAITITLPSNSVKAFNGMYLEGTFTDYSFDLRLFGAKVVYTTP
ncbi:MAG: hypothetical protein C5B54_12060 [Acidobacteria bacterium]|nr:MAG: hypothetical protein C5B54_12060 [Acidobacteriota bacterium]